jgi:hypothetical protein
MKVQTVNVMLSSRMRPEDVTFTHEIYECGPNAVPVTEIPVYQAMNGLDSVSMISPAGEYEIGKQEEWERIRAKFPEHYQLAYPSAAVPMPKAIEDLDVEARQIERSPYREIPPEDMNASGPAARGQTLAIELEKLPRDKAELRKKIAELGGHVPFGNWSVERLQAMLIDVQKKQPA